jgi:acyl-CoA synthetase (AMP-forming)/AMP-acid ligase II
MPDILSGGRWRSGQELTAIAGGWVAAVRDRLEHHERPIAVVPPSTAEGVAVLLALCSLRWPLILLTPEVRAWRTEPAIPEGTPLVLLPSVAHLARDGEKFGMAPLVLRESSARGPLPAIDPSRGGGVVLFSSGSSGAPKPVFHRMAPLIASARHRVRSMGLGPGAGVAMEASPAYAQGFNNVLITFLLGGPLALLDPRDHRQALAALAEPVFRCWPAMPPLVGELTRCALTGPAIVPPICIVSTPVSPAVFFAFRERFGVPLRQMYSSTETITLTLDDSPAEHVQPGTVGRPLQDVELRVGAHPSRPSSPGEIGRIWVRCPWLMAGYGFPPHVESPELVDGWWPTQDLGALRADGYLLLAGRLDDAIRTRDNRTVNLAHVAATLSRLDGVTAVVVLGIDAPGGRTLGAVVQCEEGLTVVALRAKIADVLAPWSWPQNLQLVRSLPQLPSGRPDRQACARLLTSPFLSEPRRQLPPR